MSDRIELSGILARGIIGPGELERREKQDILISVSMEVDLARVCDSDRVEDSVHYSYVKRRIIGFVEHARYRTVEALAQQIANICLTETLVERVGVRIEKPAIERFVRSIAVEINRQQPPQPHWRNAYVVLGSNFMPEQMLSMAMYKLVPLGRVTAKSGIYESPATDGSGTTYLNAAVRLHAKLPPLEMKRALRSIESELGRTREPGKPVCIDLDLCLVDSEVIATPELELPSPDLLQHAHAAATVSEIAPTLLHPQSRDSLATIARRLAERGGAKPRRREDLTLPEV